MSSVLYMNIITLQLYVGAKYFFLSLHSGHKVQLESTESHY